MSRFSQPNFTVIQPDGSVGAAFPGGIVIPAGVDFPVPPPTTRAVRWEASDGSGGLRAFIYTQDNGGGGNQVSIAAMNDPGPLPDSVNMGVYDTTGSIMSAVEVIENAGGTGSIWAFADRPGGAEQSMILDGNDKSDFVAVGGGVSIRSKTYPLVSAVPALAAGATNVGANITTEAPFGSVTDWALHGAAVVAGGNNGQCLSYGATIANNAGFAQIGVVIHNPSAFATAALTWRGFVHIEW